MTVCIAAICARSGVIVTASDRMVTWGHTSSESALKTTRIAPHWMAMLAGEDISTGVEDVLRHVRQTLAAYDGPPPVLNVQAALLGAWRDAQNQNAQAAVLNPFRLTVDQFINSRKQLGDAKFLELAMQLQQASKVQCQMLACGFDENNIPNLLVVDDDFGCRDFTRAGFIAIGSGQTEALAALTFHEYRRECGISEAIYRVCAAKFMSERALGVGEDTFVACLRDDGKTCLVYGSWVERIRALWASDGRPRIPDGTKISNAIDSVLKQWTEI